MVAVSSSFNHQPQIIFPCKVDAGRDVLRIPRRYRIDTRSGRPCIHPAQSLRDSRLVPDVVRISYIFEDLLAVIAPYASRVIVFHGHRHTDWIGTCGDVVLCSVVVAELLFGALRSQDVAKNLAAVRAFVDWLWIGSSASRVVAVQVEDSTDCPDPSSGFVTG